MRIHLVAVSDSVSIIACQITHKAKMKPSMINVPIGDVEIGEACFVSETGFAVQEHYAKSSDSLMV